MEKIVLVGAGGHAKTIVDTIERMGEYEIAGFIIPEERGRVIYRDYKNVGQDEDMEYIYASGIHNVSIAVGFMGNSELRNTLYMKLKKCGFDFPVIIDKTAVVAKDAVIGEGTYIGRNAVINADVNIGKCCIINTAAIIEHDCMVGDFSHISCSAVLCGNAVVGSNAFVGANSTVIQECRIGDNCIIGAGSIVRKNVEEISVVVGNNRVL